jgi:hypothetical protein
MCRLPHTVAPRYGIQAVDGSGEIVFWDGAAIMVKIGAFAIPATLVENSLFGAH